MLLFKLVILHLDGFSISTHRHYNSYTIVGVDKKWWSGRHFEVKWFRMLSVLKIWEYHVIGNDVRALGFVGVFCVVGVVKCCRSVECVFCFHGNWMWVFPLKWCFVGRKVCMETCQGCCDGWVCPHFHGNMAFLGHDLRVSVHGGVVIIYLALIMDLEGVVPRDCRNKVKQWACILANRYAQQNNCRLMWKGWDLTGPLNNVVYCDNFYLVVQ